MYFPSENGDFPASRVSLLTGGYFELPFLKLTVQETWKVMVGILYSFLLGQKAYFKVQKLLVSEGVQ